MNHLYCIVVASGLVLAGLGCRSDDEQGDSLRSDPAGQAQGLVKAPKPVDDGERPALSDNVAAINQLDEYGRGTPLYQAVYNLDVEAVRRLLSLGADVNKGTEDRFTPLHCATEKESEKALEIARILVSHGADINAKVKSKRVSAGSVNLAEGYTPLHNAASTSLPGENFEDHSNVAMVAFLLEHGAHVNARDAWGYTPLFDSLFPGFLDVMELLIEHGADLDIQNSEDGGTALHAAACNGHLEAVKLFVSHGANIHARDFEGETPLHEAALLRDREMVDCLVRQGADLQARSKRGERPQDFLDEPNDVKPILLSGHDTYPLTLIRTDGLRIRLMLKSAGIDYDTLWLPSETDIDGLDRSLRKWLEEEASDIEDVYIVPDYILSHFDEYHREYAGFVEDGTRNIFSYMVQAPTDPPMRVSPGTAFLSMIDGGCAQARVIFAARSKAVLAFRCGDQPRGNWSAQDEKIW